MPPPLNCAKLKQIFQTFALKEIRKREKSALQEGKLHF